MLGIPNDWYAVVQKAFDTRLAILESGKVEFLEHGFEGASLRTICKRAGVTTGAFYAHFDSKDQLFATLVADELEEFGGSTEALVDRIVRWLDGRDGGEAALAEWVVAHRTLLKLLAECAEGSSYAHVDDAFFQGIVGFYRQSLGARDAEFDESTAHCLALMKLAQCSVIYNSDMGVEQARRMTREVASLTSF